MSAPEWIFCYADKLQHDTTVHKWDCDRLTETLWSCSWRPFTRHRISLKPDRMNLLHVCEVYKRMEEGKTLAEAVTEYWGFRYRRLENALQDFLLPRECQKRRPIPLPYNIYEYVIYYYYRNKPSQYFEVRVRLPFSLLCTIKCAEQYLTRAIEIADTIAEDYLGPYRIFFDRNIPEKGIELVAAFECDSKLTHIGWTARVEHLLLKGYTRHYTEGWEYVLT